MKINNFEKEINPTILRRGKNYFDEGFVEDLEEHEKGVWIASINGTYDYEIEITVNNNSIQQWYCDCPYDGSVCKHVVAILFGIRKAHAKKSSQTYSNNKKPLSKLAQLNKVFEKTNHQELIDYLKLLIKSDKALLNKTLLHFQSESGKITATDFNKAFNLIIKKYSSYGFIDYQSAKSFSKETGQLLESLNKKSITAIVRVDSCFLIIETMMKKLVDVIDDSNGDLSSISMDLSEIINKNYPELTQNQQISCFKKILFWEFESELGDYGLDQYFEGLSCQWAKNNTNFQELYLQAIDKALNKQASSWSKDFNLQKKLDTLQQWGRTDESDNFALENINIPEIREVFVHKAIKNKDYQTARSLIAEGITLSKQQKHPGVEARWRRMLIDIARKLNDVDSIRKEVLKLQKDSWFDIKLYRELKDSYKSSEWKTLQAAYATKMLGENYRTYDKAEIYAEENQLRELFDLIQADAYHASSLFKDYQKVLNKEFPEESVHFYAIIIHHELERTGRNIYQQAVRDIEILQKLTMGEAIAKQLIKESILKYQNRPAMLEIFKKAFGNID